MGKATAAAAADPTDGLSDFIDVESEETDPTIVEVDTSGDRDDDSGIAEGATVTELPIRLEPSEATTAAGMSLVPYRDELKGLTELAVTLAIADNTPSALKGKPAAVLAVFLTGRELGIPPMTALRNLHVIDGKVTVNPKVRAAMVRREGLGRLWPHQGPKTIVNTVTGDERQKLCECGSAYPDNNGDICTWHAERADDKGIIYSSTYTLAMAGAVKINSAGGTLAQKDNWKNYPDRMLSWRALGYLLDDAFPEIGTGLYSPDELGAITDEDGEPVIDVDSTEVLTDRASKARKERKETPDPPASPDTIKMFNDRIDKIRGYKGAPEALGALWSGQRPTGDPGTPLPKVENLLYKDCKMAAALLDMIERRIGKGEFVQVESDAVIVEDGTDPDPGDGPDPDPEETSGSGPSDEAPDQEETSTSDDPADTSEDPQNGSEGVSEAPELVLDVASLPSGLTPADDLAWTEAGMNADPLKTRALIDDVAVEVQAIDPSELIPIMKALDLSPNGLNEATKRARIAARRARLRIARLAGLR